MKDQKNWRKYRKAVCSFCKKLILASVRSIVMGNGLNVASSYLPDMKLNCQVFVVLYTKLLVSAVENTEMCMYMVHPTKGNCSF